MDPLGWCIYLTSLQGETGMLSYFWHWLVFLYEVSDILGWSEALIFLGFIFELEVLHMFVLVEVGSLSVASLLMVAAVCM